MNYQITIDAFIGPWAYSKQYVRNMLAPHKGKHVDVKISSLGGNLDHGLDIRQQFIDHGDVTAYLSGFVASAATVIAMGAKRIVMSKYAMFLVHKCSNFIDAWGSYNADEMQKLIDELTANKKENDKIDVVLANMYADRCKKNVSEILNILKEGRWLSAQEALELGFIDEIAEVDDTEKLNFTAEMGEKFLAMGIPTLGLTEQAPHTDDEQPVSDSLFKHYVKAFRALIGNPEKTKQLLTQQDMKKKTYNFAKIGSLLNLDSITPDADGDVTVSAEQFEAINNRLEELENSVTENSAKDVEIERLKTQIENLKNAPGADTSEIKDDGANDGLSQEQIDEYINEFN